MEDDGFYLRVFDDLIDILGEEIHGDHSLGARFIQAANQFFPLNPTLRLATTAPIFKAAKKAMT